MPERFFPIREPSADSLTGSAVDLRRVVAHAKRLWREEEGKDTVEYALLVALLSLAGITALVTLGKALGFLARSASSSTAQGVH